MKMYKNKNYKSLKPRAVNSKLYCYLFTFFIIHTLVYGMDICAFYAFFISFSGQTTKVLPSLHYWLSGPFYFFFFFSLFILIIIDFDNFFSSNFWAKKAGFTEKNVIFSQWSGGVYPPYTLSGPTTKKKHFFMCVFPQGLHIYPHNHKSNIVAPPIQYRYILYNPAISGRTTKVLPSLH